MSEILIEIEKRFAEDAKREVWELRRKVMHLILDTTKGSGVGDSDHDLEGKIKAALKEYEAVAIDRMVRHEMRNLVANISKFETLMKSYQLSSLAHKEER